jgi:hypothetical protein
VRNPLLEQSLAVPAPVAPPPIIITSHELALLEFEKSVFTNIWFCFILQKYERKRKKM